jgi:hypothetical protein
MGKKKVRGFQPTLAHENRAWKLERLVLARAEAAVPPQPWHELSKNEQLLENITAENAALVLRTKMAGDRREESLSVSAINTAMKAKTKTMEFKRTLTREHALRFPEAWAWDSISEKFVKGRVAGLLDPATDIYEDQSGSIDIWRGESSDVVSFAVASLPPKAVKVARPLS